MKYKNSFYLLFTTLLILFQTSLLRAQEKEPFEVNQILTIYKAFESAQGGVLNEADKKFFIQEIIRKQGIAFPPTPTIRARLLEKGIDSLVIKSLTQEIFRGRGIGMYVFDFSSKDKEVGRDFSKLVHLETEIRKPEIHEIIDRKEFLPSSVTYNSWKDHISSLYSFYVIGEVIEDLDNPIIIARIRFRPAGTKTDSTIEIPPLEIQSPPNRIAAKEIAAWFVDSIINLDNK